VRLYCKTPAFHSAYSEYSFLLFHILRIQIIECIPEYLCKDYLLFRCICSTTKHLLSLFSPHVCLRKK
jgi:hypothetical protein